MAWHVGSVGAGEAQLDRLPARPVSVNGLALDDEKVIDGVRRRQRPAKGMDGLRLVLPPEHGLGDPGLIR